MSNPSVHIAVYNSFFFLSPTSAQPANRCSVYKWTNQKYHDHVVRYVRTIRLSFSTVRTPSPTTSSKVQLLQPPQDLGNCKIINEKPTGLLYIWSVGCCYCTFDFSWSPRLIHSIHGQYQRGGGRNELSALNTRRALQHKNLWIIGRNAVTPVCPFLSAVTATDNIQYSYQMSNLPVVPWFWFCVRVLWNDHSVNNIADIPPSSYDASPCYPWQGRCHDPVTRS